jgi:hypothetical protein
MNQTTRKIVDAFQSRRELRVGNSYTDGEILWLFGNRIAKWVFGDLWITNAGWKTRTTKERLNGLDGVNVVSVRGHWNLNGMPWSGDWVNVSTGWYVANEERPTEVVDEIQFNVTSEWVDEGYSKPVYSVFHSTDEASRRLAESVLTEAKIPYKLMESDTAGVYRPNYFIVVRPKDFKQSLKTITQ